MILTWNLWVACAVDAQSAGGFDLSWHKIAGGGGTSTGGVYAVSGTIGQHDASGPMTNGAYSLTGGFWVLPTAVQTPGAPVLTITSATHGNATISWTPNTPGYTLQSSTNLTPTGWLPAPSGTTNPVVLPLTDAAKFYRVIKR